MKLSRMLNLRGTKYAYLALAMVLNIAWALLFFSLVDTMMLRFGEAMQGVDTTLMLGIFLGSLTIGFLITLLAKDRRGPTYGIYGGIAGLVVIVLMTWKSGLLSALVGFMAIFGGINGGTLGEMYQQIQRKKK
ncbi:MAG: hypothetical protein GX603_00870 [Chloroflexi bacterium]|nr:hypothetical protein [Chloroflexota bacterium]